jgi:hypothetical protein
MASDCATDVGAYSFRDLIVLSRRLRWISFDPHSERDDNCGQYDEAERESVMHGFGSSCGMYWLGTAVSMRRGAAR